MPTTVLEAVAGGWEPYRRGALGALSADLGAPFGDFEAEPLDVAETFSPLIP